MDSKMEENDQTDKVEERSWIELRRLVSVTKLDDSLISNVEKPHESVLGSESISIVENNCHLDFEEKLNWRDPAVLAGDCSNHLNEDDEISELSSVPIEICSDNQTFMFHSPLVGVSKGWYNFITSESAAIDQSLECSPRYRVSKQNNDSRHHSRTRSTSSEHSSVTQHSHDSHVSNNMTISTSNKPISTFKDKYPHNKHQVLHSGASYFSSLVSNFADSMEKPKHVNFTEQQNQTEVLNVLHGAKTTAHNLIATIKKRDIIQNQVLLEGQILGRLNLKDILIKEWHDTHFILKDGFLVCYHARSDHNTTTRLKAKIKDKKKYKLDVQLTNTMRVGRMSCKMYNGHSQPIYSFMLEELMDFGVVNIGKFGSAEEHIVHQFRSKLRDNLKNIHKEDMMY